MEKFRILKKTYGSGAVVFIPQYLYDRKTILYKDVCFEMRQITNSFETEKEAFEKIEEYKKYLKDSKVVSEEVIQINDGSLECKQEQKLDIEQTQFAEYYLNQIYPEREQELVKIMDDLTYIHEAFKNIDIDTKESIFVIALNIIKNNEKLSIKEAIKDALFNFGIK